MKARPTKRRRLSPEERRAELLEALDRVVHRHGSLGATVPRVVAEAGVAQGSFYRYFPDIDTALSELAEQLLAPVAQAALDLDVSRVSSLTDLEAALMPFYRAVAATLVEHAHVVRELMLAASLGKGPLAGKLALFLSAMRDRARELLARRLARRRLTDAELRAAAGAVVGMVLGAVHEATQPDSGFEPEGWARMMARFETGALAAIADASGNKKGRAHGTRD